MSSLPNLPPAVLPNWVPRKELSRPSAETLNRVTNRKQTLTYAGPNAVIPIVYGEQIVSGPVIAGPVIVGGNQLRWAVALCYAGSAGVERVEDARLGETIITVPNITVPNNPATGSVGGVGFRVYDGRQTAPDSTLVAAIPGFTDAFEGIAYVVFNLSSGQNFSNFPDVTFRVKGRKTRGAGSTLVWSENPVDHMRDFVTNTEFGMGVDLIRWQQARNRANSLYSGIPRCQTGLSIQDAMTQEDALALFAEYAEVLWSYDGRDVTIVPDYPGTIRNIDARTIREGSLQLSTVGLESIPTQVRITFSDRNEPIWSSRPAVAEVPEHSMHGLPVSPSAVPLPGVYQRLEAERRAYQRLMRLQSPGRVQWQMFAPGMPYQAGDIVRLPDRRGLSNLTVRLMAQPEMIAPLLYQMAGEIYRASDYPEGAEGIAVPTGAILIYRNTGALPAGWEAYSISDRLVREGAPGNQGSVINISMTFTTDSRGAHIGTRSLASRPIPYIITSGEMVGPTVYFNMGGDPSPPQTGSHTHSGSISASAPNIIRRRAFRFIRRTAAAGLLAPGVSFFGGKIPTTQYFVEAPAVNRYLAGSSNATERELSFVAATGNTSTAGLHAHNAVWGRSWQDLSESPWTATLGQNAGAHSHPVSASVTAKLRSVALAIFESLGDAALPKGAIVGWEGATAPPGWAFCNGSNGTVDLRDRFIYLTASESAGIQHETESSYQVGAINIQSAGAHQHNISWSARMRRNPAPPNTSLYPFHDSSEGSHVHGLQTTGGSPSGSLDNIQRYQLRFIQYLG